eukprot:SAG31_NODE_4250_length_3419_cov_24.125904_3_plen_360_part_00
MNVGVHHYRPGWRVGAIDGNGDGGGAVPRRRRKDSGAEGRRVGLRLWQRLPGRAGWKAGRVIGTLPEGKYSVQYDDGRDNRQLSAASVDRWHQSWVALTAESAAQPQAGSASLVGGECAKSEDGDASASNADAEACSSASSTEDAEDAGEAAEISRTAEVPAGLSSERSTQAQQVGGAASNGTMDPIGADADAVVAARMVAAPAHWTSAEDCLVDLLQSCGDALVHWALQAAEDDGKLGWADASQRLSLQQEIDLVTHPTFDSQRSLRLAARQRTYRKRLLMALEGRIGRVGCSCSNCEAGKKLLSSSLCPLLEKYGTFIARCNALIEKLSPFISSSDSGRPVDRRCSCPMEPRQWALV